MITGLVSEKKQSHSNAAAVSARGSGYPAVEPVQHRAENLLSPVSHGMTLQRFMASPPATRPAQEQGKDNAAIQRKITYSESVPDCEVLYEKIQEKVFWLKDVVFYTKVKYDKNGKFLSGEEYDPIRDAIEDIEGRNSVWSVAMATTQIAKHLAQRFPKPPTETSDAGKWKMTKDEFKWYIVQNFKTMSKVVLDSQFEFDGLSGTDDEKTHSEMNSLGKLDEYINGKKWGKEEEGQHNLVLWINNSPCFVDGKCAQNITSWDKLKYFKNFTIKFLSPYGILNKLKSNKTEFHESVSLLKSKNITLEVIQTNELPMEHAANSNEEEIVKKKIVIAERALASVNNEVDVD